MARSSVLRILGLPKRLKSAEGHGNVEANAASALSAAAIA